jgi:serine protease Do
MAVLRRTLPWALLLLPLLASPARSDGEIEVRRSRIVLAVEKARPATVAIHTTEVVYQSFYGFVFDDLPPVNQQGLGSGTIFHPGGFVLTNAHVIARASTILVDVTLPGRGTVQREGRILAVDVPNDLAIVRLVTPAAEGAHATYPFLPVGRSNDLMLGETVIAVGDPFGLGFTVTTGVVGALDRTIPGAPKAQAAEGFIQIDAAVNPGNSGGALMDVTGRWIGVTTAIYARSAGGEGIGFAIPADRVRNLIGRAFLRRSISGDWLGIDETEGKDGSAEVSDVYPKGPAAASGLHAGDVIASVDGRPTPTLFDYRMAVADLPVGATATLGIVRDGRPLAEPVRLPLMPVPTDQLSSAHLGATFSDVDEEITRETRIPYDAGVFVRDLRPGGPGERIHLRQGDLIVGLGPMAIHNSDDVLKFLQQVQAGDVVAVRVRRPVKVEGENRVRWEDKRGTLVSD